MCGRVGGGWIQFCVHTLMRRSPRGNPRRTSSSQIHTHQHQTLITSPCVPLLSGLQLLWCCKVKSRSTKSCRPKNMWGTNQKNIVFRCKYEHLFIASAPAVFLVCNFCGAATFGSGPAKSQTRKQTSPAPPYRGYVPWGPPGP